MPTEPHRVPRTSIPSAYRVQLTIDPGEPTFTGRVEVDLAVVADDAAIVCNAAELDVESATVDGSAVTFELDPAHEQIRFHHRVTTGDRPVLGVSFTGSMTGQLVGLYRSSDTRPDGTTAWLASTQMEATHARKVFPCWDEPDLKATFEIVVRAPSGLTVVSNSDAARRIELGDGWTEHHHRPTMALSTYLVAVVVGELVTGGTAAAGDVPIRVLHTGGSEHLAPFALAVARHAVPWFEDYFGLPFPAPKLDLVGIPDFSFGAMENHGCVTFRESALLLDQATATPTELERVATVIAHEIAHMWFGNLVTMEWWDGIWLNEAFATFMELKCADSFEPAWDVWQRSNLGVCAALDTDSLASTRAIEHPVVTPSDADDMFDELTYEKGAAVLRMIEGYLGHDRFRAGVRRYLATHRGGNTRNDDLWGALEAETGEPMTDIAATWIRQGGHPIVTATPSARGVVLEQRAFRYAGADDRLWRIPIAGTAVVNGAAVAVSGLLDHGSLELELGGAPEQLRVNPGRIGCYRVAFDDSFLSDLDVFEAGELLAVADDLWASVLAGRATVSTLVDLLERLPSARLSDDSTLWRRLSAILKALANASGPNRPAVADLSRRVARAGSARPLGREAAALAFTIAGVIGRDPRTLATAVAGWDDPDVEPALTAAMLNVAASQADEAFVRGLLDRYRSETDPQQHARIVTSLGEITDPSLAPSVVDAALSVIRSQSASSVLAGCLNNASVAAAAWGAVESRWEEVVLRVPTSHHDRILAGLRGIYDGELASRIASFLDHTGFGADSLPIRQHRERMTVNVGAAAAISDGLTDPVGSDAPGAP